MESSNKEQSNKKVSLLEGVQAGSNGLDLDLNFIKENEHPEFSEQDKPVTKKKSTKQFSDVEVVKPDEEMERIATEENLIVH